MTNRADPAASAKISGKTRCRFIASNENARMPTPRPTKKMLLLTLVATTYFTLIMGCTSAPTVKPVVAKAPRIVPAFDGFVVCTDCDNFLPTPKHIKTHAQAKETVPDSSVAAILSIAPNEQIVPANATNPVIEPSVKILFETNEARIRPTEATKLRAFLRIVDVGSAFAITGYTDATGSLAANKRLADRRAIAVKDFVVSNIHAQRVAINEAPACCSGASDKTSAERAMNRRVELKVSP